MNNMLTLDEAMQYAEEYPFGSVQSILACEIRRLRDEVNGLTGSLDHAEKAPKESRANDMAAMSWLADCRIASGDHGKRMLPEFVEYLRIMKQQRDELLAALKDAGFILDMLRTASNGEKRLYAKSFAGNTVHVSPVIKGIESAIAKAEAQS